MPHSFIITSDTVFIVQGDIDEYTETVVSQIKQEEKENRVPCQNKTKQKKKRQKIDCGKKGLRL